MDDKEIPASKAFRNFAAEWAWLHRQGELSSTPDKMTSISVNFFNGEPHYRPSLVDKRHQLAERRINDIVLMGRQKAA